MHEFHVYAKANYVISEPAVRNFGCQKVINIIISTMYFFLTDGRQDN